MGACDGIRDTPSLVEAAAALQLCCRAAAAGEKGDHLPDPSRHGRDSVSASLNSQRLVLSGKELGAFFIFALFFLESIPHLT